MSNDPWRNARVMYEKDTCARKMGIELIEMDDGFAQMSMTVSADMLNGHQTCHGGQLFTLADTAFAYACNSRGLAAVASAASIDFLRPAFAGDRLVATARVKQQGKLTGVYDIEIVNQQQDCGPVPRQIAPHRRHNHGDVMRDAFICDGIRTPIGRYGGALASAPTTAAIPLRELLSRNRARPGSN